MNKIIILTAIFFISFHSLSAEIVKDFKVEGNERISSETIKVYGDIELNVNYDEIRLNTVLKNLYETDFF